MPPYKFRSNANTPQGAVHPVDLHLRVLSSLHDTEAAGIPVHYEWSEAEIGADALGEYVVLDIEWPEPVFGAARKHLDAHFVTIEYPTPKGSPNR